MDEANSLIYNDRMWVLSWFTYICLCFALIYIELNANVKLNQNTLAHC